MNRSTIALLMIVAFLTGSYVGIWVSDKVINDRIAAGAMVQDGKLYQIRPAKAEPTP